MQETLPLRRSAREICRSKTHFCMCCDCRSGHIATIANDVDKARSREEALDRPDVRAVAGMLVEEMRGAWLEREDFSVSTSEKFAEKRNEFLLLPQNWQAELPAAF